MTKREFTADEARAIGDSLGIDWNSINLGQFQIGLGIELEHGKIDSETNITDDDLSATAKIALAHLKEYPDYYSRLEKLEEEAETFWNSKGKNVENSIGEEVSGQ